MAKKAGYRTYLTAGICFVFVGAVVILLNNSNTHWYSLIGAALIFIGAIWVGISIGIQREKDKQ